MLQGSQDDTAFVTEAAQGADAPFWLTPPDYRAPDFQNKFGHVAAAVVRGAGIRRLVNLSSVGAHVGSGCGQVDGAADVEKILNHCCPQRDASPSGLFHGELRLAEGRDREDWKHVHADGANDAGADDRDA